MDVLLLVLRIALAALLYTFLGAVLVVLWRDLRQAAAAHGISRPAGQLIVLAAADEGPKVGTAFALLPVTPIGRAPTSVVLVPDGYASAQHALLSWREGQWWLEDLGSRNGTLLNGEPITKAAVVSAGDVITVGRTQLKVELDYGSGPRQ